MKNILRDGILLVAGAFVAVGIMIVLGLAPTTKAGGLELPPIFEVGETLPDGGLRVVEEDYAIKAIHGDWILVVLKEGVSNIRGEKASWWIYVPSVPVWSAN